MATELRRGTGAVRIDPVDGAVRTAESDAAAEQIFRANLANLNADGSATCAFVLPSAVDGRPAYRADPLANDQDWGLTPWLRLPAEEPPTARG